VEILNFKGSKFFKILNKVVDFQDHVGQAIKIIQYLLFKDSLILSRLRSKNQILSKFNKLSSCFKILITTFSP
jgi:hypothetical protein